MDHHSAQRYGEALLRHYRSLDSKADVERVTRLIAGAIERAADKVAPMLATAWLNDAYLAYAHGGLKDDAERVLVLLKQKGRESRGQMISHTVSTSFTREEMGAFLDELTGGTVDIAFSKITCHFVPEAARLRQQLAEQQTRCPLSSLFPIAVWDDDQVVAHVGSTKADEEGRLVHEVSQEMQFRSVFLALSVERMCETYCLCAEHIVDMLYRSPLFGATRHQLLRNGIRHYREGDYMAAVHVLVPQIEHALRTLLGELERATSLHNPKLGAYQEKDLGAVLADEAVIKVLGEDATRYLRTLLTDQRGWNLRNRISHGLYDSYFFSRQIADRVFHVLMIISFIRPKVDNGTPGAAT